MLRARPTRRPWPWALIRGGGRRRGGQRVRPIRLRGASAIAPSPNGGLTIGCISLWEPGELLWGARRNDYAVCCGLIASMDERERYTGKLLAGRGSGPGGGVGVIGV